MSDLVTLSKNSPEFESYLLGTFAKDKRALPVKTLNANSASETVTFRVVPVTSIERPNLMTLVTQTFKVRSFLLVLLPLFLVLTKNIADQTFLEPITASIATIGVLLAFVAVNLRNDYMDHMKGVDRVLIESGSRAIQKGWVTAAQVKSQSSLLLTLAVASSLPIVFAFPSVAMLIASGLFAGLWAQFKKADSFKYQIGGELVLFLLLGPLLTVGYQLAMGAPYDQESFWLGCVWGWLVLFIVHLRNFVNLMPSAQAGFTNTVTWLGFDKARRLIAVWWLLFILFNFVYHALFAGFYWGFYLSLVLLFVSINFIMKLKALSSPVGSDLKAVFRSGYYLFLIAIGLWIFECLWYLYL
ncbi:prenyltransferase [Bdellovibrio reynosensis]|uniref:Prenyltransferase n=1 Tax=Bdellovibrio reynosensis TaxID=2835041 RepID=A0ABY4C4K8_9BACT|nr:prenyltransferase [Bdellovibrio reynosensis]UOE99902.1 prenyltransferase [Bdellovibrio reynosensis]